MTSSRALGVAYTNSTGKPIEAQVILDGSPEGYCAMLTISGVQVRGDSTNYGVAYVAATIPADATYIAGHCGGGGYIHRWVELR